MKYLQLTVGICLYASITACQQKEVINNSEEMDVSLEATIAGTASPSSRTVVNESGNTSFVEGDKIGFFMPDSEKPVAWTLGAAKWTPSETLFWPDKVKEHTFCAFYPYDETDERGKVPMTLLHNQTGLLEDVGEYDFLAARKTSKYADRNGAVSFVFKHVYSLVSLTVKSDISEAEMLLNEVSFEGDNLFTSYYYGFATTESERDGIVVDPDATPIHTLKLAPQKVVGSKGHTTVVLVNPAELEKTLTLSIAYERDGYAYTASTSNVRCTFEGGKLYHITLNLKKGELLVEGNTVEDWSEENLGDIFIDEEPVE